MSNPIQAPIFRSDNFPLIQATCDQVQPVYQIFVNDLYDPCYNYLHQFSPEEADEVVGGILRSQIETLTNYLTALEKPLDFGICYMLDKGIINYKTDRFSQPNTEGTLQNTAPSKEQIRYDHVQHYLHTTINYYVRHAAYRCGFHYFLFIEPTNTHIKRPVVAQQILTDHYQYLQAHDPSFVPPAS